MAIWKKVREQIEDDMEIQEINLRNGTLEDCAGCPFKMCLHFGERGQCFYGGAMQNEVYPAGKWADGILLLPLQGVGDYTLIPRALPWAMNWLPFQGAPFRTLFVYHVRMLRHLLFGLKPRRDFSGF